MNAKCGNVKAAEQVFNGMKSKSLSSWNGMISGLDVHGEVEKALGLFSRMVNDGLEPDYIPFVGVLSACNHADSLELGRSYFTSMIQRYKIYHKLQHYGCVVDLFGKLTFDEVEALTETMNVKPDGAIRGSLLRACGAQGQVELSEFFSQHLFELEPDSTGVLYDMDEEWKECALSYHSEKFAIAFGLLSKPRTTIRITENLRVCRNCQSATKLIPKIFNRDLIMRTVTASIVLKMAIAHVRIAGNKHAIK
ncbi:hypothetical protein NL676_035597 [Syzygium grande]|nr:hypothetical protein NL676_035597 [Syzygium grande]